MERILLVGKRKLAAVILILLATSALVTVWALGTFASNSPRVLAQEQKLSPSLTLIPISNAVILQALTTTESLPYYSYTYERSDSDNPVPTLALSGDVISRTMGYAHGVTDGKELEIALLFGTILRKSGYAWSVERAEDTLGSATDLLRGPQTFYSPTGVITRELQPFAAAGDYLRLAADVSQVGSDESRNGIRVQHFTFQLDPVKLHTPATGNMYMWPPPGGLPDTIGTGDIWIDPVTHYIHEFILTTDPGWLSVPPIAYPPHGSGTTTPIAHPTTHIHVTLERHDDMSLAMPAIDRAIFFLPPAALQKAIHTTDSLTSYHYSLEFSVGGTYAADGHTLRFEGDVVPRGTYIQEIHLSGSSVITQEHLLLDGQYYSKQGSNWVAQVDPGVGNIPDILIDWLGAHNRWELVAGALEHLHSATTFREHDNPQGYFPANTEYSLDFMPYTRTSEGAIEPRLDALGSAPIALGQVQFYLDTYYIRGLSFTRRGSYACNQPVPCGAGETEIHTSLTYVRQNDTSLAIPTP